jgi:ankyrin repeat protein
VHRIPTAQVDFYISAAFFDPIVICALSIFYIVKYKNIEIVNILLQYNCETQHDETDLDRGSILHVATDLGNLDIVKLMVEKGKLSMNIGDRWKITPVHVAAAKNRIEILRYFVENNVDHDIEDIFGNTPLGWAVFCKADECIEYLKSLNAKEKEFVVPPPPPASNDASEELTDIPLGTKPVDGKLNPSFELNETKTETTIV